MDAVAAARAKNHERHIFGWAAGMAFTQLAWLIAALMILANHSSNAIVIAIWVPLMVMTLLVLPVWAVNGLDH